MGESGESEESAAELARLPPFKNFGKGWGAIYMKMKFAPGKFLPKPFA
jgi:hypothetical protein